MADRYVMEVDSDFGDDAKVVPVPDPWGQWVRVSDYESNLAQARTEIERLTKERDDLATRAAQAIDAAEAEGATWGKTRLMVRSAILGGDHG